MLPLLAPLLLAGACYRHSPGESHTAEAQRPDIVLILIDTLRADHLGAYGYTQGTSPLLDRFAARATVYENALSQAPHTIPSVLQIMTSRYQQGRALARETPTLAEALQASGYETAAIVENANFEFTEDARGLKRGFDVFYRNGLLDPTGVHQQHWKTNTPADVITAQARRWLQRRGSQRSFFLWLHYFDPHDPYLPPFSDDMEELSWGTRSELTGDIRNTPMFPRRGQDPVQVADVDRRHLLALYDAEIRHVDQSLGELFELLRELELFESSLIVVASDHGESFGEHGHWTHGTSLWEQQLHIPMIIKYPDQRQGRRWAPPVEAIDIFPTVLDVAGVPNDYRLDGTSLLRRGPRVAFVFWRDQAVVRSPKWKLLRRGTESLLFHIEDDPGESVDVAFENPEVVRSLLAALDARLEQIEASADELEATSEEVIERMRALGYLQ